ncbi:Xaa-Pro dipeptidase [Mycena indigotica]|uniref:Xaa-Pro dipeptidase n=1 Tax=Mycena indigotica TaxID=2126181 RepID=A0A8H6S9R1_9AGAR|nr:Xaa-Pro dipeptidase [Mycena indigotica]KAF7294967.1 Xaa-Pro dipeptidase [Mycena indigotica]
MYPAASHVLRTCRNLISLLPSAERTKPQVLLVAAGVVEFRNDTDRELAFRQESNFFYLSGCSTPGSYILVSYQLGTSLERPSIDLFIPKANLADMMWSVPPPSIEAASATHDVTKVHHVEDLSESINTLVKSLPGALWHTLPRNSPLFPALSEDHLKTVLEADDGAVTDFYLLSALHRTRLIKDENEVELIRKACDISSRAHEVVMRVLGAAVKGTITVGAGAGVDRPLLPNEWLIQKEAEAEGIFVASCRREGSVHQAYLPIVAASTRASTLHYCCNGGNDKEFAWGPVGPHDHQNSNSLCTGRELKPQVLLIDAGCEWSCYASDITRTMPVGNGGKFTDESKAIYSLVLEMQTACMEALKPGLHWDAAHLLSHRTLVKGFQRLGIFKSPNSPGAGSWASEEAILASGVTTAFYPHGLGHSLGMDVHDVPSASKPGVNPTIAENNAAVQLGHSSIYTYLRLRLPLEAGMVVTVEPGIYFSPHLLAAVRDSQVIDHEVLKRYEPVGGVRIEDVVHITPAGVENLTKVKSDVEWLEGVCSGHL